jgi:hypothetical protein
MAEAKRGSRLQGLRAQEKGLGGRSEVHPESRSPHLLGPASNGVSVEGETAIEK